MRENRQAKRVVRPLNIKFAFKNENPSKWNMSSIIGNISAAGVKFISTVDLKDKELYLEISSPLLVPRTLKLEAAVLESKPSEHVSYFDIRAKFLNVTQDNKKDLGILERAKA